MSRTCAHRSLDDSALKKRIAGLKAIREQAKADRARPGRARNAGNQAVSPDMIKTFARTARERLRLEKGGYRRDHLRARSSPPRAGNRRLSAFAVLC
jgi:site-specific DNA recombinase